MKILIIANGDIGNVDFIKSLIPPNNYVICVDGGTRHAKQLDIMPNIIIGDFDSLQPEILSYYKQQNIPILKYPKTKDRTDTHIAVDMAIDMNASQVYMIGALGSRWDHSYANILLLLRLEQRGIRGKILHSNNIITLSNKMIEIKGNVGDTVSLLPLGDSVHILSTEGLEYPIHDKCLPINFPIGISNVLVNTHACVYIKSGWVIAVKAKD